MNSIVIVWHWVCGLPSKLHHSCLGLESDRNSVSVSVTAPKLTYHTVSATAKVHWNKFETLRRNCKIGANCNTGSLAGHWLYEDKSVLMLASCMV